MSEPEIDHIRLADLQDELRYLLNRWDPIGIYDEVLNYPPDEYDCLIGPLLTRLARHDSRATLSEYLWNEVENHSGSILFDAEPTRSRTASPGVVRRQESRSLTPSEHPHLPRTVCLCGDPATRGTENAYRGG